MLVCARLRHVAGTQWGSKKHMSMKHLEAMEADQMLASQQIVRSDITKGRLHRPM